MLNMIFCVVQFFLVPFHIFFAAAAADADAVAGAGAPEICVRSACILGFHLN